MSDRTCSKGWGTRCPRATGPRCKCKCGGHNHGNPKARPDHDAGAKAGDVLPMANVREWIARTYAAEIAADNAATEDATDPFERMAL